MDAAYRMTIQAAGREFPCTPSMGAMLRFKEETGKEITEIDGGSLTEMFTYLWCCVASACAREGVEFGMSRMELADRVMPEDMAGWRDTLTASGDGKGARDGQGDEKKSQGEFLTS